MNSLKPLQQEIEELRNKIRNIEQDNSQKEALKEENEALQMQLCQIQEDFYSLQETTDALKVMLRDKVKIREEQLYAERDLRLLAEQRIMFMEDKLAFVEDNSEAVVQHMKFKYSQSKDDISILKRRLGDTLPLKEQLSKTEENNNLTVNNGNTETEICLMAREQQLERLAAQLDLTNHQYLKQTDEIRLYVNQLERTRQAMSAVQKALWKARREKDELQSRIMQFERAVSYRNSLSSSSVPVLVPLPDLKTIRDSPFLIPPQIFLADLKAEIETMIQSFRGNMTRVNDTTACKQSSDVALSSDEKCYMPSDGCVHCGSRKFQDTARDTTPTENDTSSLVCMERYVASAQKEACNVQQSDSATGVENHIIDGVQTKPPNSVSMQQQSAVPSKVQAEADSRPGGNLATETTVSEALSEPVTGEGMGCIGGGGNT